MAVKLRYALSLFGVLLALVSIHTYTVRAEEGPGNSDAFVRRLLDAGLKKNYAYTLLTELASRAPHRLSGSADERKAIALTMRMMDSLGFQEVHAESIMVPHWVRGQRETAAILLDGGRGELPVAVCALGGSVATRRNGITAEIVEVHSFEELARMGEAARGKIVFFNRPMDPTKLRTFEAYGGAVDQRSAGAVRAAEAGGIAALVRSVTLAHDRAPHTGAMGYKDGVAKIPAAAISTMDADTLSSLLKRHPRLKLRMHLDCQTLPD
ncbi:MAG: peptidase, partial [Bacteroidetes bacterium]|nr:peptidase [Bacteroidota bacterium]